MNNAPCDIRDTAVLAVLRSELPHESAHAWLQTWQIISRQRSSVYDSIVTFVNLLEEQAATGSSAWLRVLLIDAVTQAQGQSLEVA
jgi:hypothetical protein